MLEVVERCCGERLESASWSERLKQLLPSYGSDPLQDSMVFDAMRARSNAVLGLTG